MKDYAAQFYSSAAWKHTREAYAKSQQLCCELCRQQGLIVPGVIVHHKVHITPDNINDPSITLSWDNLQLVCREHHEQIHRRPEQRYTVDENGKVFSKK